MEEIVDFLQMNYRTSNREETYWRAVRHDTVLSDWLREKLDLWQYRYPDMDDTHNFYLFDFSNFIYVMYSKGYFAKIRPTLDSSVRREDWQAYGRDLNGKLTKLLAILPGHYELLTSIRAGSSSQKNEPRIPLPTFAQSEPLVASWAQR
jgi:beta-galactosidase GanA